MLPFSHQKLFIVTGKGGTGKSLCSYALAREFASSGKKTLLLESSLKAQLGPFFGVKDSLHEFYQVSPNLDYMNLSPRQCLGDYFIKFLKQKTLYNVFFNNVKFSALVHAVPGILEVALLSWVYHVADRNFLKRNYQRVVFDSFATGHFLKLIMTPGAILNNFFGGLVVNEIKQMQECLLDSERTEYIIMGIPERLIMEETLDLIKGMRTLFFSSSLKVVINKVLPEPHKNALIRKNFSCEHLKSYIEKTNKEQKDNFLFLQESLSSHKDTSGKPLYKDKFLFSRDLGFLSEPVQYELIDSFFIKEDFCDSP